MELSHLDEKGQARMVDVSGKDVTRRTAVAGGFIRMSPDAVKAVKSGTVPKGDVLAAARIAGIQAAKRTGELIPLCHPLPLDQVTVDFSIERNGIEIKTAAVFTGRTGVEMEALTAVSVAALTIYDMCKSVDKTMEIGRICLLEKSGGRSGHYVRGKDVRRAKIIATCLSEKKGTAKDSVGTIRLVENHGVEGDAHAGPGRRQVSLIGIGTIEKLKEKGIDVGPGSLGENLTIEGIIPHELPVGTKLRIGEALLEVTQIGKECHASCAIREQVGDCPMPREGIFAAVLKGGDISVGQTLEIV